MKKVFWGHYSILASIIFFITWAVEKPPYYSNMATPVIFSIIPLILIFLTLIQAILTMKKNSTLNVIGSFIYFFLSLGISGLTLILYAVSISISKGS